MKRSACLLSTPILAAMFVASPANPAFAVDTPPETGCAASNQVLSVADLTALGHHLPALIDEAGNNNGLICAKQLAPADQEQTCLRIGCEPGDILYFFRDDSLTR